MTRRLRAARSHAGLALTFLAQLFLSAWAVARAVLAPRPAYRPAILAVPLDLRSDAEIALLANMVSLTPGTTSLHVSDDRRTLYVHVLDAGDPDKVVADIKSHFESKLLGAAA